MDGQIDLAAKVDDLFDFRRRPQVMQDDAAVLHWHVHPMRRRGMP
jgi:hypothetical protein